MRLRPSTTSSSATTRRTWRRSPRWTGRRGWTATRSATETSYRAALIAAGLGDRSGAVEAAFALVRPPGHHATRSRDGLLPASTTRVAARGAAGRRGSSACSILDWDVHHGNGTQDIFGDDPTRALLLDAPVPVLPGHRRGERRPGERERRVNVPLPAGRATTGPRVGPTTLVNRRRALQARPDPRVGRLRRPPRRSAGRTCASPHDGFAAMAQRLTLRSLDGAHGRQDRGGARGRLQASQTLPRLVEAALGGLRRLSHWGQPSMGEGQPRREAAGSESRPPMGHQVRTAAPPGQVP